jgi:hypothetical protein
MKKCAKRCAMRPMENSMHEAGTATPSPSELIARARALIPLLAERAAAAEAERALPDATIADMQAAGFFRVLQPKRWGGYEMDMATYFEIQLALAEGDMSVAWVYGVVGVHPWLMGLIDDRAAHDVWGEDDTTLVSSSLMPGGTVTRAPGGFRLSGRWKFSSGCRHCGWAFLGGERRARCGGVGRSLRAAGAARRLSDPRYLARRRPQGHRQPRHRGRGCLRARPPGAPIHRHVPRRGRWPRGQHIAALSPAVRADFRARRLHPRRSARCRACSTPS